MVVVGLGVAAAVERTEESVDHTWVAAAIAHTWVATAIDHTQVVADHLSPDT